MAGNVIQKIDWTPEFTDEYDAYSVYDDDENLSCDSLDECINVALNPCLIEEAIGKHGEIVEIFAFKRRVVTPKFVIDCLESLWERLDEEYGGPDGVADELTSHNPITTAANNLAQAISAHYPVWACEVAAVIRVQLREWAVKNG